MPKFPPSKKSSRKKRLDTADDWLQEAISLEESGDRWLQDPAKCHRFYVSAVEAYDHCLSQETMHFDAAYNRARLFLQMSQVCALLLAPRIQLVQESIQAHRALLCTSDARKTSDVAYNAATAWLYYAELAVRNEATPEAAIEAAIEEALTLLQQCRLQQVAELSSLHSATPVESDVIAAAASTADASATLEKEGVDEEMEVSYISQDVLLDTLIAMAEGYTQLLELEEVHDGSFVSQMDAFVRQEAIPQMHQILPLCQASDAATRVMECLHAMDIAAIECGYLRGSVTLDQYRVQVEAWTSPEAAASATTAVMLCANADACIALASASRIKDAEAVAWAVLTTGASAQVTRAITLMAEGGKKAPVMWITKADIEILRASLQTDTARRNRATLLKNATVYYKRAMAECLPRDILLANEASFKLAIVEGECTATTTMTAGATQMPTLPKITKDEAAQILADARSEGLFEGSWRLLDAS